MKIRDDAHYEECLKWLVERSKVLANPLLKAEDKAEHMRKYDAVETACLSYRMPHLFTEKREEPKKESINQFF